MRVAKKLGRLSNRMRFDLCDVHHIVDDDGRALCGTRPGKYSAGWSTEKGYAPTCNRCVKKSNLLWREGRTLKLSE